MPNPAGAAAAEPFRVEVRRVIQRPIMEVFRALTEPSSIARWIHPGNTDARVEAEPRLGGRLFIDLVAEGKPWTLEGRFTAFDSPRRLAFTWVTTTCPASVGSEVTIALADLGGRTLVHLVHEGFPDGTARSDHEGGWEEIASFLAAPGLTRGMKPAQHRLEVRRFIEAPAEAVFRTWTDQRSMEAKTGANRAQYLVVEAPRLLVFTWVSEFSGGCTASLGSVVTVRLRERDGGTDLVLIHEGFPSGKSRDDHDARWAEFLIQLAAVVKGKEEQA